ncbi:MAG: hypothetical protein FWH31_05305 [Streptococcaceae bacterium]|nr:hypothetical protein [Streptococcaceae bacterium]
MNKLITLGLSVATVAMLSAVTLTVKANQTIVGPTNTADITVKGQIGFDPGEGGETIDPEDWIKVKLPTAVVFSSTAGDNHESIKSAEYAIQNLSVKSVDVTVSDYDSNESEIGSYISDLWVKSTNESTNPSNNTEVQVIADGTLTHPEDELLVSIPPKFEEKFVIFGNTDKDWHAGFLQSNTYKEIDSSLKLKFTPVLP